MTATTLSIILFVFLVALTDFYRWRQCRKAPLTESVLKAWILIRFFVNKETRTEFMILMNASSFGEAAKAYLKR